MFNEQNATQEMTYPRKAFVNFKALWPFFLFYFLLVFFVQNNSFFWDEDIIYSVLAQGILKEGADFIFQNQVDVGYFPGLAFVLSAVWSVFGISLPAMHWVLFPVSIGLGYEIYRFVKRFLSPKYVYVGLLLVLVDPTIMSQSVMFSTDLFQIYLFFAAINAVIDKRPWLLTLVLSALVLIHGRGTITVASIYFSHLLFLIIEKQFSSNWFRRLLQMSWAYVLPLVFTLAYLFIHYQKTGWIGYHEDSPWAGCYEVVDAKGFFRNIIIAVWRIGDFGKFIFYPLLIIALFILYKRKENIVDKKTLKIIIPGSVFLLLSLPGMLIYTNLIAQRYMLIFFASVGIYAVYLLYERLKVRKKWRVVFSALLITSLIGGNFWVYPDHIAQDWSSTLGHLPFYKQRIEMIKYIEEQEISYDEIGTLTPNRAPMSVLYLNDNKNKFKTADLDLDKYIYYSNIINDFSDEEIAELKSSWTVVKEFKNRGIRTTLYKRTNIEIVN